jgi:dienelactone hydrolase
LIDREVEIAGLGLTLDGQLTVPDGAGGLVIFAHGSGSSRFSPRNRYVARVLEDTGLATLLFDLLTPDEDEREVAGGHLRFDIALLADRLALATEWAAAEPSTRDLHIGYFGASTGAGAALAAAARFTETIGAVVSRGGRPDLAGYLLGQVVAPTLLIVGGYDETVIDLNRAAMRRMRTEVRLEIIPGATHLFEEPRTLERAAMLAGAWFERHLIHPNLERGARP